MTLGFIAGMWWTVYLAAVISIGAGVYALFLGVIFFVPAVVAGVLLAKSRRSEQTERRTQPVTRRKGLRGESRR